MVNIDIVKEALDQIGVDNTEADGHHLISIETLLQRLEEWRQKPIIGEYDEIKSCERALVDYLVWLLKGLAKVKRDYGYEIGTSQMETRVIRLCTLAHALGVWRTHLQYVRSEKKSEE